MSIYQIATCIGRDIDMDPPIVEIEEIIVIKDEEDLIPVESGNDGERMYHILCLFSDDYP